MLHITVIANEKKKKTKGKIQGGVGGWMQRQGTLGARRERKEEERKGNEGGVRG